MQKSPSPRFLCSVLASRLTQPCGAAYTPRANLTGGNENLTAKCTGRAQSFGPRAGDRPYCPSKTRTVLSQLADTIFVPSGLNCAESTQSLCPPMSAPPCRHAPHAHSLVLTRRYDIRAIRAKLRRIHRTAVCAPPMSAHTPLSPRSARARSCPHSPIRYSCHPG